MIWAIRWIIAGSIIWFNRIYCVWSCSFFRSTCVSWSVGWTSLYRCFCFSCHLTCVCSNSFYWLVKDKLTRTIPSPYIGVFICKNASETFIHRFIMIIWWYNIDVCFYVFTQTTSYIYIDMHPTTPTTSKNVAYPYCIPFCSKHLNSVPEVQLLYGLFKESNFRKPATPFR